MNLSHNKLRQVSPFGEYFESTDLIDWESPIIQSFIDVHPTEERTDFELIQDTYQFVRDQISHSYDIGSKRVTASASEVLEYGEGICYAKSHLLAALLRGYGIPSGVCYQRLTLGDTAESGHCLHSLNSVYYAPLDCWLRLDARGNTRGICAEFSVKHEMLAFTVRPEMDEKDYWDNFAVPHHKVAMCLALHSDCTEMCARGLPSFLESV